MTRRSTLLDWPTLPQLDGASGGFSFRSNCECGGGWTVEGQTLGRDDKPGVCRAVSQIVYCAACGLQAAIDVSMRVIGRDKRHRP